MFLRLTAELTNYPRFGEPFEFDHEDRAMLVAKLSAARDTCEPFERFALDRLIDLLTTKEARPA